MAIIAMVAIAPACVGPVQPGPLAMGGADTWEVCILDSGELVTAGDLFTAPPTGRTVLEGVQLTGAEGLVLDDAYIAPIVDEAYGAGPYPPVDSKQWPERTRLDGAQVDAGSRYTIFLVLRPTSTGEHVADGFKLRYAVDGENFERSNSTSFVVANDC